VCRELTKRFEEVVRGAAAELAARYAEPPRGEVTLVVAPGGGGVASAAALEEATAAVAALVAAGTPRRAAAEVVARLTGAPRNELYRRTT
jgi:16S rRNA (cytidine1402-2'-O)-methyltransferase